MRSRLLVVEFDGRLIRSDVLIESGFVYLKSAPNRFYEPLLWLVRDGNAGLNARLVNTTNADVTVRPYDPTVLIWVKAERDASLSYWRAHLSRQGSPCVGGFPWCSAITYWHLRTQHSSRASDGRRGCIGNALHDPHHRRYSGRRYPADLLVTRVLDANHPKPPAHQAVRRTAFGRRQLSWPACCLTKECYPTDCCRFAFLLLFFRGFPGAQRPAPAGFQLFCSSHFSRRFGALAHAAQNHFSHTLSAPCVDPAMQRS